MHICLLPTEILLDIFATIHQDYAWNKPTQSSSTVAALARTCRRFKDPALDTLWQNMSGFKPLMLCFPESVRGWTDNSDETSREQLTLNRPLFTEDWNTFNFYACRIRSLIISDLHLNEIDDRVVTALISTSSPMLLPNLHRLEWADSRDAFLPLLRALLTPKIKWIGLECWDQHSLPKCDLLVSLGARCPNIKGFLCPYYDCDYSEYSNTMSEAVCCWSNLAYLGAGILNRQALTHLATLPFLMNLHFTYDFAQVGGTRPNDIPTFISKIDRLSIAATSFTILTECFRDVRFTSCLRVILEVGLTDMRLPYDQPSDVADFILSLSECFSQTLEHFVVEIAGAQSFFLTGDSRYALPFDAIAPLLPFSHLKVVDLGWICSSAFGDAMVSEMAQSWPLLEDLHLGTATCWLTPPSLTFTALVYLIRHCRHLRNISMVFLAGWIDKDSEPFSDTIPNEKITHIYVGHSLIDDPMTVARQLRVLLPNLISVKNFDGLIFPPQVLQKWDRVREFIGDSK